jgi:hypothetical protein
MPAGVAGSGVLSVVGDGVAGSGVLSVVGDGVAGSGVLSVVGDGVAGSGVLSVVGDGVAGSGVLSVVGLAADVQEAAVNRPAMIAVATRVCDKRIPCPFGRCTPRDGRPLPMLRREPGTAIVVARETAPVP